MVRLVGCIIAIAFLTIAIAIVFIKVRQNKIQLSGSIGLWVIMAFLVRIGITIVFSFSEKSTHTDMIYWIRWTEFFQTHSFSEYYQLHAGDYTPGFMYWLKLTANILVATKQPIDGLLAQLLYKLPAMLTDSLAGIFIYKCAIQNGRKQEFGVLGAVMFMFHPTVLFLSAVWGQIDIMYTLLIAVAFYLLYQKRIVFSAIIIAAAILIKLQTVFIGPIYIVIVLLYLAGKMADSCEIEFLYRLRSTVVAALAGIGILLAGCLPGGLEDVFVQVTRTMSQYQNASLNAANFWTLVGQNMQPQTKTFLGVSFATYGYLFLVVAIILSVLFTLAINKTKGNMAKLFTLTAWMYLFVFTFTVRMHERYIYPALLLFLCAYVVNENKKDYVMYAVLSLTSFVNFTTFITIEKYHGPFQTILWMTAVVVVGSCIYMTRALVKELRIY